MKLNKYLLAAGAAATICTTPLLAETIYDANGNLLGSFRDTGVNRYFYDQYGNDLGYSRDTGGPVYYYDRNGNLLYEVR